MTTTKVRFSMDRASSTNTIDSSNNTQGEETEETEESEGALNDQMRLLKKERKLSDDREGGKMEFLSAAFMRRGFGVGAGSNANDNNKNSKSKHRRTESEPPPKVTGRGNNSNNSSNNSGKEQPSGRTPRMSRLVSETADDSYKAFEDDGEDEQQTQIEQKNVRRSMTTNATLSTGPTAATRHFRGLSVSAAKFERGLDGSNVGKDLRASIFEALEKSNTNKEDVPQQVDRPATPFDDNNCCPTCLEEYHDDNPKITLASPPLPSRVYRRMERKRPQRVSNVHDRRWVLHRRRQLKNTACNFKCISSRGKTLLSAGAASHVSTFCI